MEMRTIKKEKKFFLLVIEIVKPCEELKVRRV